MSRLGAGQLAAEVGSPQFWRRDTARRLLVERQLKEAAPLLARLARESAGPVAVLNALHTLDGLGVLGPRDVVSALGHPDPSVRRQALRFAERWLDADPRMLDRVLALAADRAPMVRLQLALSLGESGDARVLSVARSTGPLARRRAVDGAGDPDRRAGSRRRLVDRAAAFAGRAGEGRGATRTPLRGHRQPPARIGVVAGPGSGGGPGGSAAAGELPARHAVELAGANDRRALRAGPRVRQDAVAQSGCCRPQPGPAVDHAAGHRDARRAARPAGPGRRGSRRRAVVRRGAAGGRGPARRRQRSR